MDIKMKENVTKTFNKNEGLFVKSQSCLVYGRLHNSCCYVDVTTKSIVLM